MKKRFKLEGLDCANCASKIEAAVSKLTGVKEATVNFMTQKLIIEADDDNMSAIINEAQKIIGRIEPGTKIVQA
ncbi:MAG: heavy metal transporter [Clostridiales bacterium]|jgi:copper chaperone CopZ|nr:heavy metal transporter [Clostridiales bacterium]